MRKIALVLTILTLAACSSGGGSGYGGAGNGGSNVPYRTDAHFLASDPTVIELVLRDPLPAARVFLIDPNGVQTAAYDIQRDKQIYRSDSGPQPSIGVGVGGGSGGHVSSGIGIGFPIFSSGQSNQTSAVIDSRAKVRIDNPVLYRTTWQSWKLRVELDDGVNHRVIEMLPPKPL